MGVDVLRQRRRARLGVAGMHPRVLAGLRVDPDDPATLGELGGQCLQPGDVLGWGRRRGGRAQGLSSDPWPGCPGASAISGAVSAGGLSRSAARRL